MKAKKSKKPEKENGFRIWHEVLDSDLLNENIHPALTPARILAAIKAKGSNSRIHIGGLIGFLDDEENDRLFLDLLDLKARTQPQAPPKRKAAGK